MSFAHFMRDAKPSGPKCETCGGSGKIRAGHVSCPDCGGSGRVKAKTIESVDEKLVRMRIILKTAREDTKAAQVQHREESGRYVTHPEVGSHDLLARHMSGPGHSMAILPAWRGSTKNMALAHEAAHVNRPTNHAVDEVSE